MLLTSYFGNVWRLPEFENTISTPAVHSSAMISEEVGTGKRVKISAASACKYYFIQLNLNNLKNLSKNSLKVIL